MPEVTLTEADNGQAIELRQGDVIHLLLRENPTTGFRWQVVHADGLDEEPAAADEGSEPGRHPQIGAGGVRTLRFRALTPGTGRLELKLWRAFEEESSVVNRFVTDITIAD